MPTCQEAMKNILIFFQIDWGRAKYLRESILSGVVINLAVSGVSTLRGFIVVHLDNYNGCIVL